MWYTYAHCILQHTLIHYVFRLKSGRTVDLRSTVFTAKAKESESVSWGTLYPNNEGVASSREILDYDSK